MDLKKYFTCVAKGVLGALILTILSAAILSLIMMKFTFSENIFSVIYVVISCVSLVIGSIVAAKAHGSKGWILGLGVSVIFYIILFLIGIVCGAEAAFSIFILIKFALCILIGVLAGMLGINL